MSDNPSSYGEDDPDPTDLRTAWEEQASNWSRFATEENDPSYWLFIRPRLLELLPPPGRLTVDVGCGEGRFPRELARLGHRVVGVDGSPAIVSAAAARGGGPYVAADGARLPLRDGVADLAVSVTALHDFDDLEGAVAEVARVLSPGGRFCFSIVHPINSAGRFERREPRAQFGFLRSYLAPSRYRDVVEREGFTMTFRSMHRPLEAYGRALEAAGLLIETLREPGWPEELAFDEPSKERWRRVPLFLFVRAVKPA